MDEEYVIFHSFLMTPPTKVAKCDGVGVQIGEIALRFSGLSYQARFNGTGSVALEKLPTPCEIRL